MQWGKLKQLDTLSTGNETILTKTSTNPELATNWNEEWQSKSTLTFGTYKKSKILKKLIFISKCHLSLGEKTTVLKVPIKFSRDIFGIESQMTF